MKVTTVHLLAALSALELIVDHSVNGTAVLWVLYGIYSLVKKMMDDD